MSVRELLFAKGLHFIDATSAVIFFVVKMIVIPVAATIVFLVWCTVKARSIGLVVYQPSSIHGSSLAWAMVVSLMACISNSATLVTNALDFASRARTPSAALYPQLFAIPLTCSIVCLMGILVSYSSQVISGEAIWLPIDLLGRFLDDNPSRVARPGVHRITICPT
ncbi:permease for cytosine/purines, uracil, thiamine, allantoin-domain-containing protein [Pisolithus orientalis]|uniref:permease for cytosine/purines, uracil, thiamine, allantoin-domain-containing protein n=1 Tax=Pisolithus orientalis TaxID=936130 RepID=UPI00222424EF|nr:permease for cytosine/purines, uracil, thiamine, allantoin-domain-containing protein [Pisolithus orientalis]KAI6019768.1 permease for cytosine/purines, uracil, thiamine, allantoin-domain-containing protein [Pisolithus orientalis]